MSLKKLINVITSFLPWISFTVLSVLYLPLAIPAGIIFSLTTYPKLIKGFILDWASLLFFIVIFIDYQILKDTWLIQRMSIFIPLFFVAVAAFSMLIHRPFTMQYAKLEVNKALWNSPQFIRCNQIMTAGFGFIFLLMGLANQYQAYYNSGPNQWLVWGIGIAAQAIFIDQFPKWYRKRHPHKL